MNKKSFILGAVSGIVLTLVVLFVVGLVRFRHATNNNVHRLEHPVSYENKEETCFQVFQVFDDGALANEFSEELPFVGKQFRGNVVVLLGKNFYTDQIVMVKKPQRIGTYSYTSKGEIPMTVPIIDGEME